MTNKAISVGIIGTGFGKVIAQNFKAVSPDSKIYLVGLHPEKTGTISKELDVAGVYGSWQELIASPEIDLVVIASPSALHQEMSELAIKSNKNVLIEKPAALSSVGIKAIEEVARSSQKIIAVNHEGRFHPVVQQIKETIESGKLGRILTVRCAAYVNWFSRPDYVENWNNYKEMGGSSILSLGTHQIDLLRYLLGMPDLISGSIQNSSFAYPHWSPQANADTQFSAHFFTPQNTSLQISCDCYCFGYKDFTIEILGSQGVIMYSDTRGLKASFANSDPLQDISWTDPLPEITLGNSILTRSMKHMVKALIESINSGIYNSTFCSLSQARENLSYFEKFAQ